MIRFIYGHNLILEPKLAWSMFEHRAEQFARRLGWEVQVDQYGLERDFYDTIGPLYAIVTGPDGGHLGSMRFLPTVGRTMLHDHFQSLSKGVETKATDIWECTRFCLAPGAPAITSNKLLAAGAGLMREYGLRKLVAVFDRRMIRVYRKSGVPPKVIGSKRYGGGMIGVGSWDYSLDHYKKLLSAAEITGDEMELYLANSDAAYETPLYA